MSRQKTRYVDASSFFLKIKQNKKYLSISVVVDGLMWEGKMLKCEHQMYQASNYF